MKDRQYSLAVTNPSSSIPPPTPRFSRDIPPGEYYGEYYAYLKLW